MSFGRGLGRRGLYRGIMKDKIKKLHDFLINRDKVKAELYWIRKLWYLILLVLTTIYVIKNFGNITRISQ